MTHRLRLLVVLALTACARPSTATAPQPTAAFDLVLENGRVIDGTGGAWFPGDVAIIGDRIARIGAVGSLRRFPAKQRINVQGLVVAPGFIDIQSGTGFLGDSRSVSKVTQGITTEILDAPPFYYAEDYHQQYLAKNPGGYCGLGGTGVSCPIGLGVAAE